MKRRPYIRVADDPRVMEDPAVRDRDWRKVEHVAEGGLSPLGVPEVLIAVCRCLVELRRGDDG